MARVTIMLERLDHLNKEMDKLLDKRFEARFDDKVMASTEPKLKQLKQEFLSITDALMVQ